MRFVIVLLALLSCGYGAEQTNLATHTHTGRQPPQHIKDFVEQHIKHVKQQIPLVQQQIKEGKIKVKIDKPNVAQEKQLHIPLISSPSLGVPPFVEEKIKKLQEHVKHVMEQVEIHIPQVINHQIALKQKIKDKQQHINPTVVQTPQNTKTSEENVHKVAEMEVQPHVPQVTNQHVEKKVLENVIPSIGEEIVKQIQQHVPQVLTQHVAQKRDVQGKPVIADLVQGAVQQNVSQANNQNMEKKVVVNKPVIPAVVKDIIQQVQQHVPQVVGHVSQIQERDVHGNPVNQDVVNHHPNMDKKDVTIPLIPSVVKEQQHVPQVVGHVAQIQKRDIQEKPGTQVIHQDVVNHHSNVEKKEVDNKSVVPSLVQEIVHQIQQHVPQVVSHAAQVQKRDVQGKTVVPGHDQGIVQQHVTQVINEKKDLVTKPVIPDVVKEVVQQVHQHVPQIINHVAQVQKRDVQNKPIVPDHIQGIVEQVQQHVPQVVSQHVGQIQKKVDEVTPTVPIHIQDIVHQHIQQVINDHVNQVHKKVVVPHKPITHDIKTVVVLKPNSTDPSDIHSITTHIRKKVHHVAQQVDKQTPGQVVNNSNLGPSRVQQVQKENNIVPLRTT